MDKKRIIPAITSVCLGGVWLWLSVKHIPPPQALNQALIGAVGATFATGAIPKKETTRGA